MINKNDKIINWWFCRWASVTCIEASLTSWSITILLLNTAMQLLMVLREGVKKKEFPFICKEINLFKTSEIKISQPTINYRTFVFFLFWTLFLMSLFTPLIKEDVSNSEAFLMVHKDWKVSREKVSKCCWSPSRYVTTRYDSKRNICPKLFSACSIVWDLEKNLSLIMVIMS